MIVTLNNPEAPRVIPAPPSKSAAHRALICAAFADKSTKILLSASCEDIDATACCLTALGAICERQGDGFLVTPVSVNHIQKNALLDCGESGSTLRFLLPVTASIGANATFLRRGRLPQRPLSPLTEELTRHGLQIEEQGDLLLTKGKIGAGDYRIAANVSSQYISGLLLALSLFDAPSTLTLVGEVESAPYIKITTAMLAAFGAPPISESKGSLYNIAGRKNAPLKSPGAYLVEGDFSGAAFGLAMGAIGKHPVTVTGLSLPSTQGDSAIADLLTRFGAKVSIEKDRITVSPAPLTGIAIDARQIPDLVPILAVVAAAATGETRIENAARLRAKESDRLVAVRELLEALGGDVTETADGLIVRGNTHLRGGRVNTYGDHRIAMSAAVAALIADGEVSIPNAECVNKSYASFFEDAMPTKKGAEPQ